MTRNAAAASILTLTFVAIVPTTGIAGGGVSDVSPAYAEGRDDVFVSRLRAAGVTPTLAGVKQFLENVTATPEQRRVAKTWIRQLGSASYSQRVAAMEKLRPRRIALAPELIAGQTDPDPEVAQRCTRLLHDHDPKLQDTLFIAVLETIVRKRYRGLLVLIERVFAHSQSPDVYRAAVDAVVVTTTPSEMPTLLDWLQSSQTAKVILAIHAFGRHGEVDPRDLAGVLEHPDSMVRLAATTTIARRVPKESLATCQQLLTADLAWVRADAARVLRDVTGQKFGYWAYAKPDRRGKAIRKWSEWLRKSTSRQQLKPLPMSWRSRNWLGQRLVCRWGARTLEEFDPHKRSNLSVRGFKYPWGCWGTPQGHRLVLDTELLNVREFGSDGSLISFTELPGHPSCVQRLKNGNTLFAMSDPHQLLEYNTHGEVVWKFPIHGRPTTAQRLANGDTLVNLQKSNQVVMVRANGDVDVLFDRLAKPYTAEMLDNGNILVCETEANRVFEFNENREIVWSVEKLQKPAQAQRLPNGNTLVSDKRGLIEFLPSGQVAEHWPLLYRSSDGPEADRVRFHFY
ncbi:hypothetical protein [Thalassoroseus pseudoceratinae]|uniref:hypothetical protein n=1 Tax=Thalassoroseus pseudoceratinae TaxID=2713176 RepID=UPI0014206CAC|nr:hypothetical protein [Thalassoroseus pseudoceratinae]